MVRKNNSVIIEQAGYILLFKNAPVNKPNGCHGNRCLNEQQHHTIRFNFLTLFHRKQHCLSSGRQV